MTNRVALLAALGALLVALAAPSAAADKAPAKDGKPDLNDLSLEVQALQVIYQLELTPRQLQALAKIARDTAPADGARKAAKGSEKLRSLLTDLRTALRKHDDAKIDDLTDKVDELKDKEGASLDDDVEVTDAARKKAPEAVRLLTVRQTMDYLNIYDEVPDPVASVREALRKGVKLQGKPWTELRDEAAEEVGGLVGGVDPEKARDVAKQAAALLDKYHALKDDELAKQRADIEQAVQDVMGEVGPAEVLRNVLLRDVAELLSNPQLPAAIDGRLKEIK